MADGKVMQKYYPPDFDPDALRRNKDVLRAVQREKSGKRRRGPRMMEMRMMFPFTLQCENCKDFVYVGTKFNSKVERVRGEDYLGIAIWRFYGRCPHCRHQLILRTDPKNTDYVLESGGTRTYDSNRDANLAEEALKEAQEQEVEGDTVKALEVKSYSTAEELKTIEALDELRRINKRLMGRPDEVSDFALLKLHERTSAAEDAELDQEDLALARTLFIDREFEVSSDESEDEVELPPPITRPALPIGKYKAKFFKAEACTLGIGNVDFLAMAPPSQADQDLDEAMDRANTTKREVGNDGSLFGDYMSEDEPQAD